MVTVFKKTGFLFKLNSALLQTTCAVHYFVLKQKKKSLFFFPFLAHKKNGTKLREKAQWSKVLSSAKKQETKSFTNKIFHIRFVLIFTQNKVALYFFVFIKKGCLQTINFHSVNSLSKFFD